jgi:beta-lactamase class D
MFFRSSFSWSFFAIVFAVCCSAASASTSTEPSEETVAPLFKPYENGCFELLDCRTGKIFRYNAEQCAKRLPPMSTFKIFNSLAGLDAGVLSDENHKMKWDGTKADIASWNQDHTLQSAVKNSVVWYFQKVASDVGEERMKKYIKSAKYGNEEISGDITQFWLGEPLSISADEQVQFIRKLYGDSLPFSKRSMKIVKKITEVKKTAKGELHGKTGTGGANGKRYLGWFVGYVVHEGKPYVFATNVQADDGAWGSKAREITEKILQTSGLL